MAEPNGSIPTYSLDRLVLAKSTAIELSKDEFNQIRQARTRLSNAIEAEEAFSVLLANYFELQSDLLVGALHSRTYLLSSYEEFRLGVILVHRRLAAYLSSARSYLDQVDRLLCEHFGKKSGERDRYKDARSREYDGRLGYRFLEELRNHAQHRGRAVHGVTHSFWLDGDRETGVRKNALVPTISTAQLRAEKFRKKSILSELEGAEDSADLRPLVADYMEGLGRVHLEVRELLEKETEESVNLYEAALERYESLGEGVVGLAAVQRAADGRVTEEVYINKNWIKLHSSLVRRTRHIAHFVGAVTTNELKSI